ncbi:MAG: gluconate 2-dehydrogenase subunit 3 family protein, partial [Sphingomonadaceae bacterium]|nr:gluconate 2-dehydrogenase subunit 3 family protein [Sphingomonadaceae bacterium]
MFLNGNEALSLCHLCDIIIPNEIDSPGALELSIPSFIEDFLDSSSSPYQFRWRKGLSSLDVVANRYYGRVFREITRLEAEKIVLDIFTDSPGDSDLRAFLEIAKATIVTAYYRTEHGLHTELKVRKIGRPQNRDVAQEEFSPKPTDMHCDVVVVGSGATGSWAAKELVNSGLNIIMLDSGQMPTHNPKAKYPYELRFRNMFDNDTLFGKRKPVQSTLWACDEYRADFFIDDLDNPYEGTDHYTWIRGSKIGGRMNMWGRQVYRYSEHDFRGDFHPSGAPVWPFGYDEMAPYYGEVETEIGVSGSQDGLDTLPDGNFLPAMEFTDGERHLKKSVESRWADRKVIMGRTAILTVDHNGRKSCRSAGHCYRGCDSNSFFDSVGSIVNNLAIQDNFRLQPNAKVSRVICDDNSGKATGVEFVDAVTGNRHRVFARAIVLAASTIASTRILLASKTPQFPDGIGSTSGVLGKFLHGHVHSITCFGSVPWLRKPVGLHDEGRSNQIYIPQFQNFLSKSSNSTYFGGFGIEGAVKHYMLPRDLAVRQGIGIDLKRSLREDENPAHFFLTAFGTMQPQESNKISLSEKTDKWGDAVIKIECSYGANDREMITAMRNAVQEIAREADFQIDHVTQDAGKPGMCIHEVGSARMGSDPSTSVLDTYNRVWDMPNVLVVDGACFPNVGPQNPTLTMMAISLR